MCTCAYICVNVVCVCALYTCTYSMWWWYVNLHISHFLTFRVCDETADDLCQVSIFAVDLLSKMHQKVRLEKIISDIPWSVVFWRDAWFGWKSSVILIRCREQESFWDGKSGSVVYTWIFYKFFGQAYLHMVAVRCTTDFCRSVTQQGSVLAFRWQQKSTESHWKPEETHHRWVVASLHPFGFYHHADT